jgi:hypothetical protein
MSQQNLCPKRSRTISPKALAKNPSHADQSDSKKMENSLWIDEYVIKLLELVATKQNNTCSERSSLNVSFWRGVADVLKLTFLALEETT